MNVNLENENVSELLFHDTSRMKPVEFGEVLEALHPPTTMPYPDSGAKFTARFVGTSRYRRGLTWFGPKAKDEPGPHFKSI
jgi:hypothetical protein